jgi:signal transduction histidine kinase
LTLIADEAERVRGIVAALLDFSRQEQGEVRPVDLNAIAERTLSLALPTLRKRGVEVERQLAEQLPATDANDKQLGQVFYNLINNAAQAMSDGGTLTIRTGADERWVFAELTDEGKGIAAEDLEHVFDPFFTTKGPTEGTGLGLAVCHQIIERHGGRIDVDSTIGQGTTFRLRLLRSE